MANSSLPEKITCLDAKTCLIILVILNAIVLIFGLANLATQRWITQGDSDANSEFFGNLLEVYEADDSEIDGQTYLDVADFFDDLKDAAGAAGEFTLEDQYDLLAQKFRRENTAGTAFAICGALTLIFFLVTLLGLLLTWLKTTCRALTAVFVSLGCFIFYIGAIVYFFQSYGEFTSDCEDYWEVDDDEIILQRSCWLDGPYFMVFNLIFFLVFSILICVVNCCCLNNKIKG